MVVELKDLQYCGQLFRIHLRHIKVSSTYVLSLSAKSTFKIMKLGVYIFKIIKYH